MRYLKTVREPAPSIPATIADKSASIYPQEEGLPKKAEDVDEILRDIRYTVPHTYVKLVPAIVEKLKTH
ncbi:hypothetical protein CEXT_148531 [Caerostris extrusa]|uniref:Uncharacterized protein n=1 Tax=Caerostris extrusa TaxID=172846 RepID=A0AAV4V040_CAEEX|nr:hypothetical protein CEXT_148531 [Caerostris extrusa]